MHTTKLTSTELQQIRGGDWFETTWGVMLGSAFIAGLGATGFLGIAIDAGVVLVMEDFF